MVEKITFDYDEEADVLYVSLGRPKGAFTKEIGNVGIHIDPKTKKIVGFTILSFLEVLRKSQKPIAISIQKQFYNSKIEKMEPKLMKEIHGIRKDLSRLSNKELLSKIKNRS